MIWRVLIKAIIVVAEQMVDIPPLDATFPS
jgi:hypothetical protein